MASCNRANDKFVITKNINNSFVFTIKRNASTLPIEIQPTDTFVAHFRNLSDGEIIFTKALTHLDALSGRAVLDLTPADTELFESSRGAPEDRYYLKPLYSLTLECSTDTNGEFLAKVPLIYVD